MDMTFVDAGTFLFTDPHYDNAPGRLLSLYTAHSSEKNHVSIGLLLNGDWPIESFFLASIAFPSMMAPRIDLLTLKVLALLRLVAYKTIIMNHWICIKTR